MERRSHVNLPEVDAVLALVVHLLRSGIKPQMITVLAPYAAQTEVIRKRVLQAVKIESTTSWPEGGGLAAHAQLRALKGKTHRDPQEVLGVAKTFLLVGMIDEASKAIKLALSAGTPSAEIQKYRERIDIMVQQRDIVDAFWDGASKTTVGEPQDAIQSLKKLETCAAQWMQDSAPLAAAACVLRSELTSLVSKAPFKISEKQKAFLNILKSSADRMLMDLRAKDNVCVSTIDRYQGSENDIVIISLVRTQGIGFLQEPARRIVAQSRARLGMYFIGNVKNFSRTPHWKSLIAAMQQRRRLGNLIPLRCAIHDGANIDLPAQGAAQAERQNLCKRPCGQVMACGAHVCQLPCHGLGKVGIHDASRCIELVDDNCVQGHPIRRKCNVSKEDALCITCETIVQEEQIKKERAQKLREKAAQDECNALIQNLREQPDHWRVEISPTGSESAEYNQIKDRTEKYVQDDHGIVVKVVRIEKIFNRALECKYLEAKKNLKSGASSANEQQLFHGTGAEGLEGIPKTGFRLPARSEDNMFGRGVYFAPDSSKSAQEIYTKGSKALILSDVLLGSVCTVPGLEARHPLSKHVKKSKKGRFFLDVDEDKVKLEGFDSVYAPRDTRSKAGVKFDEMIVYNPSQAMPRYIVHFGSIHSTREWQTKTCHVGKATKREIKAIDIGSDISREADEYSMAVGHFWRLLGPQHPHPKVKQVDVYQSATVQSAYEKKKSEFSAADKPIDEIWVFHGTPDEANIERICGDGFRVGGQGVDIAHGDAHGRGVYTAKGPSTPMGYGKGKTVILCKALPGRRGKKIEEHDSWTPQNPASDWVIFKTGEQLLPVYVLHF